MMLEKKEEYRKPPPYMTAVPWLAKDESARNAGCTEGVMAIVGSILPDSTASRDLNGPFAASCR